MKKEKLNHYDLVLVVLLLLIAVAAWHHASQKEKAYLQSKDSTHVTPDRK